MNSIVDQEHQIINSVTTLQNSSKKSRWKLVVIFLIIVSLLTGGIFFHTQIKSQFLIWGKDLDLTMSKYILKKLNQQKPNQQISTKSSGSSIQEDAFANIYYADLEYNPQDGHVNQLASGKINGEIAQLLPNKPPESSLEIVYKIEVWVPSKGIIDSGWQTIYKEVAVTPQGIWKLKIGALYYPGAVIRLYIDEDKLIWTGKMPKQ